MKQSYDIVVVGSGPNGLAAAIVAARCGLSTVVLEAGKTCGGGTRSAELTLPGFLNDVCSAVHPMAAASEFFRRLPLAEFGLAWITPPTAAAHPLDSGEAVLLTNDVAETARLLGADRSHYLHTIGAIAKRWPAIESNVLGPLKMPEHPVDFGLFGLLALLPANIFAKATFSSVRARALFAGTAAHSIRPLSSPGSAAIGLVLSAVAHAYGWPIPKGGSQAIANALLRYFESLGGEIITEFKVESWRQLPPSRVVLFDTSPRTMARIAADRLPRSYVRALERYPYGPGIFKLDWALNAPIPWKAPDCLTSATVHVGGTLEEIAESERAPWNNRCAEKPFVLVTQPSLFDSTRAPRQKHTAWGYCHVPKGCDVDMTQRIEGQIERFAPGFRDVILCRTARSPSMLESENPNLVGGDVGGGSNELLNLFFRPTWRMYSTPAPGVYLCSASTPPGGGVHGMCGYHAAIRAIGQQFGKSVLAVSGLA
jgi:phytoene dehydrogenase-like protein